MAIGVGSEPALPAGNSGTMEGVGGSRSWESAKEELFRKSEIQEELRLECPDAGAAAGWDSCLRVLYLGTGVGLLVGTCGFY